MFQGLRKIGMVGGAGLAASLLLAGSALAANPLTVKTASGKVAGKWSADHQVREFLGIPYAAPPVGPLRWQPPQPATKWHGARPASAEWSVIF